MMAAKDLKNQLATKAANGNGNGASTAVAARQPADTFEALMLKHEDQFRMALPKAVGFERFMRTALSTIRGNNQLRQCEAVSVMGSLMTAAQLGLEVGPLGHAYLVPFNDNKSKPPKKLAQLIIGYRGLLHLARNSGEVKSVMVEPVYENDEFHYELGLNPVIKHVPALKDRGNRILYYGVAHFNNGGYQMRVMTMDEIYARRNRSSSWRSGNSPWKTDEDAMCRKTVLRAMWSWLPMAVEQLQAVQADETVRMDLSGDAEYIEGTYDVMDEEHDIDAVGVDPQADAPNVPEQPELDVDPEDPLAPDPRGF